MKPFWRFDKRGMSRWGCDLKAYWLCRRSQRALCAQVLWEGKPEKAFLRKCGHAVAWIWKRNNKQYALYVFPDGPTIILVHLIPVSFTVFTHKNTDATPALRVLPYPLLLFTALEKNTFLSLIFSVNGFAPSKICWDCKWSLITHPVH